MSFKIFLTLCFFVSVCFASPPKYVWNIDADLTLFFPDVRTAPEEIRKKIEQSGHLVRAGGEEYRMGHGTREFILSLPGVESGEATVGLFSTHHDPKRTEEAPFAIFPTKDYPKNPISFVKTNESAHVLNPESPDFESFQPPYGPFRGLEKKDLRTNPEWGTAQVFLFDDSAHKVMAGQHFSFIYVRNTSNDGELARIRGLIDLAERFSKANGTTLQQELWRLQWKSGPQGELVFNSKVAEHPLVILNGYLIMKKFNGALQLPADYLEGWKKQVDVAQQMRDGNFGRLEEPTAKRRFSISRWFRRSAKLEVPDFSHLPLPKPRAVKSPKPEPIGVDSRTLADIADGAHEISLFETEKYLVQRKLEDPVQGLVYVYVQSKEDPAKQLLLRIAKNAHGRDRLFQLNNGYITLKHQRIAHTKIIYQSSEAIITPTGRSFAEWLQEWKQAGTPEHTLEAYALNRLFTRLLQSPYPVQIEQLLASDLIWDGKEWSIENLDSIELGLSADTVSASYQRKVMPAWNLSLEKSCGHWIVRGK